MRNFNEYQDCCGWCRHSSGGDAELGYGVLYCVKYQDYVDFSSVCDDFEKWQAEFLKKYDKEGA